MDYTQFYCNECTFFNYNVFGRGECCHPEAFGFRDKYCRACFRLKLKDKQK